MANSIKIENFVSNGKMTWNGERGVAKVTIGNESRVIDAVKSEERTTVYGVAARMGRTGSKLWKAELTLWHKSGNISVMRTGNFSNPRGSGLLVVGFYDESANNACAHSSQYKK